MLLLLLLLSLACFVALCLLDDFVCLWLSLASRFGSETDTVGTSLSEPWRFALFLAATVELLAATTVLIDCCLSLRKTKHQKAINTRTVP